jgi:hypothetical protein
LEKSAGDVSFSESEAGVSFFESGGPVLVCGLAAGFSRGALWTTIFSCAPQHVAKNQRGRGKETNKRWKFLGTIREHNAPPPLPQSVRQPAVRRAGPAKILLIDIFLTAALASSFVAQGDHGVDAHGATRGE